MSDKDFTEEAVANDLARLLIEDIAPNEIIIFDDALDAWRKNPQPSTLHGLGFGVGRFKPFITPAALLAGSFLMNVLAGLGANYVYDFTNSWPEVRGFDQAVTEEILNGVKIKLEQSEQDLDPKVRDQILTTLREVLSGNLAKKS